VATPKQGNGRTDDEQRHRAAAEHEFRGRRRPHVVAAPGPRRKHWLPSARPGYAGQGRAACRATQSGKPPRACENAQHPDGGRGDADRHATGRCPSAGLSGWQNALSGRVCLASGGGGRPDEPCHSPSNLRASSMNPAIGPRRHWPPPPTKAVYAHEQALPVARQASRLSSRRQGSRPLLGR
jgi:hypothetical protein